MTFKEFCPKPSDAVLAMVAGLRNPDTEIDMCTFGNAVDGVCYGCAATNTLAHLGGIHWTPETIHWNGRQKEVPLGENTLDSFEAAIDFLRCGHIGAFANKLSVCYGEEIDLPHTWLPTLGDDYTSQELDEYEKYGLALRSIGL